MASKKLVSTSSVLLSAATCLTLVASTPAFASEPQAQSDRSEFQDDIFSSVFGLPFRRPLPVECDGETFPTDNAACVIALAQQGGNVLYTRHVRTTTDFADQDDPNFNIHNCNQQRVVSEEGYVQGAVLRDAVQSYGIKARSVISSQFCRAWQTAVNMYDRLDKKNPRLNFIQEVECEGESDLQMCLDEKAQANLAPLLSKRVRGHWYSRGNRALVAHDDPFKSATGYYPFPMGATYVIRPKGRGRGFEVLGCIAPDAWFGDAPEYTCNLDASLTADDFDEGVPDGTPIEDQAQEQPQ